MIVADPKSTPVTCGGVVGLACPAAIVTLEGDIVTLEVSLLASVTVTPPLGASVPNVTEKAADWPGATVMLGGSRIVPGLTTVTFAVTSGT